MGILGKRFLIERDKLRQEEGQELSFRRPVSITGEEVTFSLRQAPMFVTTRRQVKFVLPFAPTPGVINSVVIDGLTYFEPDFRVVDRQLFWLEGVIPVGKRLTFESYGDASTIGHMRLERVVITSQGQTELRIDGSPVGRRAEIYVNGKCYPETAGFFTRSGGRVHWRHQSVKLNPGDKVYILYARTTEGATLFTQESALPSPGLSRTIELAIEPKPPEHVRAYYKGKRYFYGESFVLTRHMLSLFDDVVLQHGSPLTVMSTTSESFFPKLSDEVDLPDQFFVKAAGTVSEDGVSTLPMSYLPPYTGASIASLRGSGYVQGAGYDRVGEQIQWNDSWLPLKAGDDFSIVGFLRERVGSAIKFKELAMSAGYPVFDLGEKAADIRKSMFFLSSGGTLGGEVYIGERWLTFIDERTVQWSGPFPLKEDDRAMIAFWKDPLVAESLSAHAYVATAADEGKPFAYRLPIRPKEPSQVFVSQNGQRLLSPSEFVVNDGVFNYLIGDRPVKSGDEFVFLYR